MKLIQVRSKEFAGNIMTEKNIKSTLLAKGMKISTNVSRLKNTPQRGISIGIKQIKKKVEYKAKNVKKLDHEVP